MRSRSFFKAVVLLAIFSLSAGWYLVRNRNAPSKKSVTTANSSRQIRVQKPVGSAPPPLDWDQPVEIQTYHNRPHFPLSLGDGKEYLLIINNLQLDPRASETIKLSRLSDPSQQRLAGCYFQNSPLLLQDPIDLPRSEISTDRPQQSAFIKNNSEEAERPKQQRSFYLFVTDGDLSDKKQYTHVTGKLIQHSPRVAVYLDEQQRSTELAAGLVDEIISLLEHQVLDQLAQKCGTLADVDQDGRFTILLSPWLGKLQGGQTSINGFVRPSDFRENVAEPFSNQCDMLYLNSALKPGQELFDLLSHEVTHAVVSSIRTRQEHAYGRILLDEEDWLNEGIAHIMEPGFTNRDYRISEFYRRPEAYPLIVPDYYRARLWRNHGCRGAVNLFLDWCNQLDPGQCFAYRFTHHPLTGVEKIEDLTEIPFDALFRQWSISLARQSLKHRFPAESLPSSESNIHCGRFLQGGPALHTWNLSAESQYSLKIASTASAFIYLKSDQELAEKMMLKLRGFPGMQLTLLPLSQPPQPVALRAEPVLTSRSEQSADQFIDIQLRCQHPELARVEMLSLEFSGAYLSRAERKPCRFETSSLSEALSDPPVNRVELVQSGADPQKTGSLTEFLLRLPTGYLPRRVKCDGLLVKVVLRTKADQQLVVQTELKLPLQPRQRLAGTEKAPRQ